MRAPVAVLFVLGLAACAPEIPESGPGFQDYNSYMRDRTAGVAPTTPTAPAGGFSAEGASAALDRAQGGPAVSQPSYPPVNDAQLNDTQGQMIGGTGATGARPRGNEFAGIRNESGEMARIAATNPGISDENDFNAVSSRETIASDKERIERNRAQYQVIQPGALPQRSGREGPNIVQYALSTSHPVGTQMYSRSSISLRSPGAACGGFASPDLAQEWFLQNGGPERDRRNLDPDGDGYACSWDPTPFRS